MTVGVAPVISARRLKVGILALLFVVLAACLLAWSGLRDVANVPAGGSVGARLFALLGPVGYPDPALVQRVRVSRIAVLAIFGCLAAIGFIERRKVADAIRRFFATASHPLNLAIFRIVILYQAYSLGYFKYIASLAARPDATQFPPWTGIPPIGPLAALAHWPKQPFGPDEVLLLGAVMKAACLTGIVGLFTRISCAVVAFTFLFGWGVTQWYGKVDHHHHVFWFLLVLAVSRCGDALSIDWLVRRWRGRNRGPVERPTAEVRYGLPLRICILLLGVAYFFPGFWKIWHSGFDWFLSDSPLNRMYIKWQMLDWVPNVRPDTFPLLVHLGALGTIFFELSFIFLIFGRRTFYLAGILGVAFHTTLDWLIRYGFETLRNSYVAFVDWSKGLVWIRERVSRRWSRPGTGPQAAGMNGSGSSPRLVRRGGIAGPALVGAVLFVGNCVAGAARIQDGWPLAAYPLFDDMIGDWYTGLQLVATDANGVDHTIVPDGYRKVMGQNWSLIIRRTIGERDEARRRVLLESMWSILADHDRWLAEAKMVRFYTVRRSIRPERWTDPGEDPQLIHTARR